MFSLVFAMATLVLRTSLAILLCQPLAPCSVSQRPNLFKFPICFLGSLVDEIAAAAIVMGRNVYSRAQFPKGLRCLVAGSPVADHVTMILPKYYV
jgi:hypothetical protein